MRESVSILEYFRVFLFLFKESLYKVHVVNVCKHIADKNGGLHRLLLELWME